MVCFPASSLSRTGWRLDYYVQGAVGCVTFCWSRSIHEPCHVLNERQRRGEACLHHSSACCIRAKGMHLLATPRCTYNEARSHFVLIESGAINPVREEHRRRWQGPARLVSIRVHILERPWTNDQISWRAMKQVSYFNVENAAWKELRCWLSSFAGADQRNQILVLLIWLRGSKEREGPFYRTVCAGKLFLWGLFLFFWCCFDVVGLILCYGLP